MKDAFYETAKTMADLIRSECEQAKNDVSLHFPKLNEDDLLQIMFVVSGNYYFKPAESSRNKDIRFVSFALAEALSLGIFPACDFQLKQLFDEDKAFMKTFIKKYNEQWN